MTEIDEEIEILQLQLNKLSEELGKIQKSERQVEITKNAIKNQLLMKIKEKQNNNKYLWN